MRLRHELRAEGLADRFEDAALDLQFSSLSSVGNDTKWLEELVQSLCGGDKARPRLRFVFPTRDQARPLPAPAKGCTPERAAPPRPAQASPHSQLGARRGGPSPALPRPFPGPPLVPACPQVKDSLEGWVAGSSIPCAPENADKLRARIRELSGQSGLATLCGWDGGRPDGAAGVAGRAAAVAHTIRTLRP